jgi:hypothetical protein
MFEQRISFFRAAGAAGGIMAGEDEKPSLEVFMISLCSFRRFEQRHPLALRRTESLFSSLPVIEHGTFARTGGVGFVMSILARNLPGRAYPMRFWTLSAAGALSLSEQSL